MEDPPVEPLEYLAGVKVVDIGDLRVARGKTRRPYSSCAHIKQRYDSAERRVWCADCESEIDPFDAYVTLVEAYDGAVKSIERREVQVTEAESHSLFSRAAKAVDRIWRSRRMVPSCPHCHIGLLPEDFLERGGGSVSAEIERARRKADERSASD